MKRIFPLFALFILLLSSCNKDEPVVDIRDKYVGNYSATMSWYDGGSLLTHDYEFTVTRSSLYDDGLIFSNFADYGASVIVFLEYDRFTIPHQIIQDQEGFIYGIIGSGEFVTNHRMQFTFQESDVGYLYNISVVADKQ